MLFFVSRFLGLSVNLRSRSCLVAEIRVLPFLVFACGLSLALRLGHFS
jgi:hypothetical protein